MTQARYGHAAAHHQNLGFLITGGEGISGTSKSTEITKDGVTFKAFEPLSIGLINHCMVALDGSNGANFFIGGGSRIDNDNVDSFSKRTFKYLELGGLLGGYWADIAPMPTGRYGKKSNFREQNDMK